MEEKTQEQEVQERSFTDEDFFKYANDNFSEKLGKEIKSFDDMVRVEEQVRETQVVPDYLKGIDQFTKDTNRPIEDYFAYTKDWSKVSEEDRVSEYLRRTKPYFDNDDIKTKIQNLKSGMELSEDDDADDVDVKKRIRNATLEWKEFAHTATQHLESEKEKYKVPLPNVQKEIDETQEAFNSEFLKQLNEVESVKVGELDFKVNKESLKGINNIQDVVKELSTNENGELDANKLAESLAKLRNFDQIVKDYSENDRVKNKDLELLKKNNAEQEARELHKHEVKPQLGDTRQMFK